MIGRLGIMFLIIGSGYVFSVFALKSLAGMIPLPELAGIGKIDSYLQLIIGILGFGMQTDAIRRIAVAQHWEPIFRNAQSARITFSFLLMAFIALAWFDIFWFVLILAPILAVSGDYGLYARGFAITAAVISWVRVVVPLAVCLMLAANDPAWAVAGFFVTTALTFLITNFVIAHTLKVGIWFTPTWASLKLYRQTFPIGIINLCLYFFGLGVIVIAQPFYSDPVLAVSFLALKFYVIYKGAIRVMHQTFVSQMRDESICFTLERMAVLFSLLVVADIGCFPSSTITLMFGQQFLEYQLVFTEVAVAALIFSLFASLSSHLLLIHKDWALMKLCLAAVVVAVVVLAVGSAFSDSAIMLTSSLVIGELVFVTGLMLFFREHFRITPRFAFLIGCSICMVLPIMVRYFFGDSLVTLTLGLLLMGSIFLLINRQWIFANLVYKRPNETSHDH